MAGWHFEPPNPITRFMVGVEVRGPILADLIRQISGMHDQFRRELPRKLEQQMVMVQIQPMLGQVPAGTPEIAGVTFDDVGRTGEVERGLLVDKTRIAFFSAQYTRWAEIWPLANRLLTECGKIILEKTPAVAILIEYQDRFVHDRDGEEGINLRLLFRDGGDLVPRHFIESTDICHSFHGWRERVDAPWAGFRIDNVNVAISDNPAGARVADITVQHRIIMDAPCADGEEFFRNDGVLATIADGLHDLNKVLVRRLLTEAVIKTIPGLEGTG